MIKYLAGIFDAEGYVRIRKSVPSSRGNHSYNCEVRIYMCEKEIVQKFADLYGTTVKSSFRGKHKKLAYYTSIGNSLLKTCSFITDILPHLNEKRLQLQEVYNILFTSKNKENCYQDYLIGKKSLNHPIKGELSYEYIAGMIDGDGYLTMFNSSNAGNSFLNKYSIGLEQAYRPMIDYMNRFDTNNSIYIKHKPNPIHKDTYTWYSRSPKIIDLLKSIEPFLIEKKERCNIIIDYIQQEEIFKVYVKDQLIKWKNTK